MSDPAYALQMQFAVALKASSGGGDLGVADRVYDEVPAKPVFPYLKIGDDQVLGDDVDCGQLSRVVARIHVWSRAIGKPECKAIAGAVRDRLRAWDFALPGFRVENVQFLQTLYLDDPDGITQHAVIEARFLITHL